MKLSISSFAATIVCCAASAVSQVPNLDSVQVGGPPDLDQPLFVTAPANDFSRIFIVQKTGYVKVRQASGTITTFLDVSGLIGSGSEHGLLGMAFHPAYASNGYFYIYYTDTANDTKVVRYTVSGNPDIANQASALTILTVTQPFSGHKAGCLQFGHDGYLYIALGDGGSSNDPLGNAQSMSTLLGKILRIDVGNPSPPLNYGIPPSNPFVGPGNPLDEIWALGLRNPFRFSFDRHTGDLYIGDVGQASREEIDFQPATDATGTNGGRNYGWRCKEGTSCTGLSGCSCPSTTFTEPLYDYSSALPAPETSVIGGYVYRGCAIPQLRGHYFFSDHGSGKIWSLTHAGTPATVVVVDRTLDLDPTGPGFIPNCDSFGEDAQGELYMCSIEADRVWKIIPFSPQVLGVLSYGTGTQGCNGWHVLSVSCPPTILNPGEALISTNGPPGTSAIGIVGLLRLPQGSDPFMIGTETLVDPAAGTHFLYQFTVGPNGTTSFPIPIGYLPSLVGITVYTQQFFFWTGGGCPQQPSPITSTQGLAVTLLP